jgi:anti-sigma B factor antagonist
MAITRKKGKDNSVLVFDGEITIYTVAQLKNELFAEQDNLSEKIALDLHAVTEIDTAGVQLLLFAQKIFTAASKQVIVSKSNELIDAVFTRLDVSSHFAKGH